MATEPLSERSPSVIDIVGHAFGVCTRVIRIEVLMNVEDEFCGAAIRIRNLKERVGGPIRDESSCRGPVVTRKKNVL